MNCKVLTLEDNPVTELEDNLVTRLNGTTLSSLLFTKKINILIMDDNKAAAEEISLALDILESKGIIPPISKRIAHDGDVGLQIIEEGIRNRDWIVDIVISDIEMDMMDGTDVCREIRQGNNIFSEVKNVPFIFITAKAKETEEQIEAMKIGADEVFLKPFNTEQLPYIFLKLLRLREERAASSLQKRIIDFYLRESLVTNILAHGKLQEQAEDHLMGVIFGDVVDWTKISPRLTAAESVLLLNGIFHIILDHIEKYHGFLNKTMGDGFLIHIGDPLDSTMPKESPEKEIAHRTLLLCTEMQQAIYAFNQEAYQSPNPEAQEEINKAYLVLEKLTKKEFIPIKIRLGGHMGIVNIGNIGPKGNKQYDIMGTVVDLAKRLESSAPPGGIRLHDIFYKYLAQNNDLNTYTEKFKQKSKEYYNNILLEEIFSRKTVNVKNFEKVPSFSIQSIPNLPELIRYDIENALDIGLEATPAIIENIRIYRGNKYIINAIEDLFKEKGIIIRKIDIYKILQAGAYEKIKDNNKELEKINNKPLYKILGIIGKLQDAYSEKIDKLENEKMKLAPLDLSDFSYNSFMYNHKIITNHNYQITEQQLHLKNKIHDIFMPQIFTSITSSIYEYLAKKDNIYV